jgi:hypothetical protein
MTRDIEWSHSVTVSVAVPYGRRAFSIPFSEVERFKLDQIGVAAQLLDMPREDYVRWVEQEGSVQCMARCVPVRKVSFLALPPSTRRFGTGENLETEPGTIKLPRASRSTRLPAPSRARIAQTRR